MPALAGTSGMRCGQTCGKRTYTGYNGPPRSLNILTSILMPEFSELATKINRRLYHFTMAKFLSRAFFTQSFGIPAPTLTEKNLPSQAGRVVLITGGYAGIGKELAAILFAKGATVYIAGRSEKKAQKAIADVKTKEMGGKGRLEFLFVDLNDLESIRPAVKLFSSRESRLDVLVNNAGVMAPPKGTKTKQGHDMQFGTNVLGPFLFTKLLMNKLVDTAAISAPDSVRVLWAASLGIQAWSPNGGIVMDDKGPKIFDRQDTNYGETKVANLLLALKTQALYRDKGVISVSFNPGNLRTELQRHTAGVMLKLADYMLYPAVFGAYTELYSGWSEDITIDKGISYVMPWGRDGSNLLRSDIQAAIGQGLTDRVWDWCEGEVKGY